MGDGLAKDPSGTHFTGIIVQKKKLLLSQKEGASSVITALKRDFLLEHLLHKCKISQFCS